MTVRPSFWIVAGFLGYSLGEPSAIAAWIAIVFISVLAHELGHALVARRFGASVSIQLTTLGGLTAWTMPAERMTPGRRVLVAGAGSAVGIAIGLAVLGLSLWMRPSTPVAAFWITNVVWVNLGWGILNWLPIRPLDGGHILSSLLEMSPLKRPDRVADFIFFATSAAALAAALYFELVFVAVLAGFMTWSELSRHTNRTPPTVSPGERFEFGYDEPEVGDPDSGTTR